MLACIRSYWFLISLLTLIAAGLSLGYAGDARILRIIQSILKTQFITPGILFLMAFTLDSSQIRASFRAPGPVLWACFVNAAIMPLMGWGAMSLQLASHFEIGLMIAASVPCTVAAASVLTRKIDGNDAVSLLTTLITNGLCFLTTPLWLRLTTGHEIASDPFELGLGLVLAVLVPSLLGQCVRLAPSAREFAKRRKPILGVISQISILLLVFSSACKGGQKLHVPDLGSEILGLAVVWATCIGLHLLGLVIANQGSRGLGFCERDRLAAAFAGSQKTLPVGLFIASNVAFESVQFAVFPILMFHASQLFIDSLIVERHAKRAATTAAT